MTTLNKQLKIKLMILDKDLYKAKDSLPRYETPEAAGMDLRISKSFHIEPNATILMGTGLAIHIDNANICATILPRSGLGHKEGIVLGNLVGLIDSDYQGELKLSIWNRTNVIKYFCRGDKIAQIVFLPIIKVDWAIVESFKDTERSDKGFGSTGVK